MNTVSSGGSFLELPASIRQRIYQHLLAPHPDEHLTTINYALNWPWLDNPSNTTFAGEEQFDICRCPQQEFRRQNTPTEEHIYTRHTCHGPDVKLQSAREKLWVVGAQYDRSRQLNFLRPATKTEMERRPYANILRTCKTIYQEAAPVLYRNRNFQLVTGPCPRGRYQAYATQMFLMRLTPIARAHVTDISIVAQHYEEDIRIEDTGKAYFHLAAFLADCLPSFQTLHLDVWDEKLATSLSVFSSVYGKEGAFIRLAMDPQSGKAVDHKDLQSFTIALRGDFPATNRDSNLSKHVAEGLGRKDSIKRTCLLERKASIRSRKSSRASRTESVWKEAVMEEKTLNHEQRTAEPASPIPESRRRHTRRASRIQRVSVKLQPKCRTKTKEDLEKEESAAGLDWVDAALSSASSEVEKGGDSEGWELL